MPGERRPYPVKHFPDIKNPEATKSMKEFPVRARWVYLINRHWAIQKGLFVTSYCLLAQLLAAEATFKIILRNSLLGDLADEVEGVRAGLQRDVVPGGDLLPVLCRRRYTATTKVVRVRALTRLRRN